jgi:phosphatidylglycerophosphate synthase
MELSTRAFQKQQDAIGVFWDRRISPVFTRTFVRLGVTPNQATLLWGALSVANSFTVYRAMVGDYWLVPVVFIGYLLCSVIDCADGEVARATDNVNPVAGKLLDGICHRATEYSLLGVFGMAAWTMTGAWWALPITVLLMAGDAMYSYVYERRLSILRVEQRSKAHMRRSPEGVYAWGTPWMALSGRQKLATLTGLLHYKSIYPVIALAYVSGQVLLVGLAALGLYKNWKWIRLMGSTLSAVRAPEPVQVSAPPYAEPAQGGQANGR